MPIERLRRSLIAWERGAFSLHERPERQGAATLNTTDTITPVVLIVGETALRRLPLVTLAHRFGYRPVEAGLGAEAPACYTERRAAGVLLALRRGDEAELATLRALTAAPIGAHVVVIAPHARATLVRAALQAGACAFLSQPAPEWRLVQALERVVAPPTRRTSERIAAHLPARLALPEHGIAAAPCLIEDLSLSGARCRVRDRAAAALRAGTVGTLTLTLPDGAEVRATSRVVRLVAADVVGLAFLHLTERDRARLEGYHRQASAARAAPHDGTASEPREARQGYRDGAIADGPDRGR